MYYFALSIFLSAFLLFQVEPMIAKYILPWFGGSPAVWSTVVLFFQVLLTGGYGYAAWLSNKAHRRERIHLVLLGVSVLLLVLLAFLWKSPITPSSALKPPPGASPVGQIFKLLLVSVGLPYFLLSSNSPLIQAWFHRAFPERAAYRLYALSNFGSLLALVSYPVLIDPNLALTNQARIWSLAYLAFAAISAYGARQSLRRKTLSPVMTETEPVGSTPTLRLRDALLWIGLAATASILLLAVTSQITQEVASIPFLWVIPLVLYLFTFIIAFSSERWYSRQIFILLAFGAAYLASWALSRSTTLGIWVQIGIYSFALFVACMICHGELYRLRPHPSRLTAFYLLVSLGGAIGGMVINFVVPYVFRGFWELPLGLLLGWVLFLVVTVITGRKKTRRWLFLVDIALLVGMIGLTGFRSYEQIRLDLNSGLTVERNFFGVIRVREKFFSGGFPIPIASIQQKIYSYDRFALVHGVTVHGYQFHDDILRDQPTSYYGRTGGAGIAILNSPARGTGMRVGVLGLGVGTLAIYGEAGDVYRFYEINPAVISLAGGEAGYFTYIPNSQATVEIVQGDARLSLETELAEGHPQEYDVLVLDVFSSDSIPVHLLDEEAFALYLQNLRPQGILAVHITNSHLDLRPIVATLAEHFGLAAALIEDSGDGVLTYRSTWVLLTRNAALLENPAIASRAKPMDITNQNIRLWTDDYNNLFQILH